MDPRQLHDYIIVPVLDQLGWLSRAASRLVLGTAMVESDCGRWVRQLGGGPALGIYQMEPPTHDDIWDNWLAYRPEAAREIKRFAAQWPPGPTALVGNVWYATAMCRAHYRRRPEPLPAPGDARGLARFHKLHYNTLLGATREEESLGHFQKAIDLTPTKEG